MNDTTKNAQLPAGGSPLGCRVGRLETTRLEIRPPWQQGPLTEWSIVGMNHYRMHGERRLFVAMTNGDGLCIQEEGPDDQYLWNRLCHKAWAVADRKTPNVRAKRGPTA